MSLVTRIGTLVALTGLGLSLSVGASNPALADTSSPTTQYRGAQLHLMWGENKAADITRQLDMLAATGADSGRLDVAWSSLQDQRASSFASWYVSKLDSVVAGASARGIKLVLTLLETPCWASSAPETVKQGCVGAYWSRGVTHYPPSNPADFARAASYIAERYGSRIAALEIWNEPNWHNGTTTPNLVSPDMPGAYVAMLKPAYTAVKAVAPGLPVLAASMSFSDVPFLQALYARGARGSYDGISVHPYNEWRPIGAAHDIAYAKYDFVQGLTALHAAMLKAGDTTPVWITEMGWTSCRAGGGTDRWCVTEQQQADYLPGAFTRAAAWSWIRSVIVYNLRSKTGPAGGTESNFGLVHHDYTVKPALASLTKVLTTLRSARSATSGGTSTAATTGTGSPVLTRTAASLGSRLGPRVRRTLVSAHARHTPRPVAVLAHQRLTATPRPVARSLAAAASRGAASAHRAPARLRAMTARHSRVHVAVATRPVMSPRGLAARAV